MERDCFEDNTVKKLSSIGLNIACIATALNIVCDLLFFSGSARGSDISDFNFLLPALSVVSPVRIGFGAGIGVLLMSTWFFTFPAIFMLLGNVNRYLKYCTLLTLAFFIAASISYHGSYALLAGAGRIIDTSIPDSTTAIAVMYEASLALVIPMMLSLILFSLLFAVSILSKESKLPRWTACFSLVLFASIPPMLASIIPAPLGGPIAISASTAGIAAYWGVLRVLWEKYSN